MPEFKSRARRGDLTRAEVEQLLADGQITEDQADELDQLITEFERHQQLVAAAAPAAFPLFPLRTIEIVAEEIRSNRINDGETVDNAWAYAVGLRDACVRWPRDERRVTEDLDPFTLRVLRFIYNRRFDNLGVAEGVRIIGRCSYADLRRVADQGAHEKRLRVLNGNFDHGVLKDADAADASKRGLGIPVTVLGGQIVTGLLVQHYNRLAYTVSSFGELEEAMRSPAGQGGLDLEAVQKAKESGKLLQMPSPEEWERGREEQSLQSLLGPEYWYLNSTTGPQGAAFAVLVDRHRMVLEDGARDPRPILRIIAERLSGDGVVVAEDDLWPYFGGRPAAGAAVPQRAQSVFFSEKLAAHFAGRLDLPVDVVRRLFTAHHDLAEEILARQSLAQKVIRGATQLDVAIGPTELRLGTFSHIVAGAIVGLIPAIVFRSGVLLPSGMFVGGVVGWLVNRLTSGRLVVGRRAGVAGVFLASLFTICGACSAIGTIVATQNRRAADEIFRRQREMGIKIPPAVEKMLEAADNAPSLGERLGSGAAGAIQFLQNLPVPVVPAGVAVVGFCLISLLILAAIGRRRGWI